MPDFPGDELWKALILLGLNQATYKIAFAKSVLRLSAEGKNTISWAELSEEFFEQYRSRLDTAEPLPQQNTPGRRTVMEQIIAETRCGLAREEAVARVGKEAFGDVVRRFHVLVGLEQTQGRFYRYEFGRSLSITDELHRLQEAKGAELSAELDARWALLEGAFSITCSDYALSNEIRSIYVASATQRRDLTDTVPFLQGYQGNLCFYCGEAFGSSEVHVDHVLPRQVLRHDEIWNLVLAHPICNLQKSDNLVSKHFIDKLILRNENIMRSNHPWKRKIAEALGSAPEQRASRLERHYNNVKDVIGPRHWGGSAGYNPATDPFYLKLITRICNQ
jgi:hypothetical protein